MASKNKSRSKRRRGGRRRRAAKPMLGIKTHVKMGSGFPDKMTMVLKYNNTYSLSSSGVINRWIQLRMNDVGKPQVFPTAYTDGANFDPHSAMHLEEASHVYDRYHVSKSYAVAKIVGSATPTTSAPNAHGLKFFSLVTNQFNAVDIATNPSSIAERPNCKTTILANSTAVKTVKAFYKQRRHNPYVDNGDDGYLNAVPYQPVKDQTWLFVSVCPINPNAEFSVDIDLTVWYTVTFYRRHAPKQSDFDDTNPGPIGGPGP